jgi:DNA-binding IclR family transcriptional regulator
MNTGKSKPYYTIDTLLKGLRVIELLADREAATSVTEVGKILGLDRSAAHRFLATLKDEGYVRQDSQNRYFLSLKLFGLGNKAVNLTGIRVLARPLLLTFVERHKETANLACLEGGTVVAIDMARSFLPLKVELPLGSRGPAHASSLGKVMMAFSPESAQTAYCKQGKLEKQTTRTLTSQQELMAEFQKVRKRGYAVDDEEWSIGIRCIAVPVFDHNNMPSYALSASGPVQRMTDKVMKEMLKDLQNMANELSSGLGADRL